MYDTKNWVSQRLKSMSNEEFTQSSKHRIPPKKRFAHADFSYFAVPLAVGHGCSLLVKPIEETLQQENQTLILLFHGLGYDNTYPLWHWMEILSAAGHSVLSIEWDGHGNFSKHTLDFQIATRSIPLILERLYGREGHKGLGEKRPGPLCFLLGLDMGASLALIAATRDDVSHVVQGVIAVSPAINIGSTTQSYLSYLCYLNPWFWMEELGNKIRYYGFFRLFLTINFFKKRYFPLRRNIQIPLLDQARAFVQECFLKRKMLKQVQVPILWFHGIQDKLFFHKEALEEMLHIKTAFFAYQDTKRNNIRLSFWDKIPNYCSHFISHIKKREASREP